MLLLVAWWDNIFKILTFLVSEKSRWKMWSKQIAIKVLISVGRRLLSIESPLSASPGGDTFKIISQNWFSKSFEKMISLNYFSNSFSKLFFKITSHIFSQTNLSKLFSKLFLKYWLFSIESPLLASSGGDTLKIFSQNILQKYFSKLFLKNMFEHFFSK